MTVLTDCDLLKPAACSVCVPMMAAFTSRGFDGGTSGRAGQRTATGHT